MTVPGCDHEPPCPDPEAHEAICLAEVRNRIGGTGAISGTGSGADARYLADGEWVDRSEAERLGRLPDGEDGGEQTDADYESLFPPGLPLPDGDGPDDAPSAVITLGPGATRTEVATAKAMAEVMKHHDRQMRAAVLLTPPDLGPLRASGVTMEQAGENIRAAFGVPPAAIPVMTADEAEPVAWVNGGPWEFPVSHWPGGLRGAKAAAMEADRARHPEVYGLPPVTGTARAVPLVRLEPKTTGTTAQAASCRFCGTPGTVWRLQQDDDGPYRCPPRTDCYSRHAEPAPASRQPREKRGPRPSASVMTPNLQMLTQALLDRCPICGMGDLGDLLHGKLAEWEGWPVHADCAEWIAGSDEEPQRREVPEVARPLTGRRVAADALPSVLCFAFALVGIITLSYWAIAASLAFGAFVTCSYALRLVKR